MDLQRGVCTLCGESTKVLNSPDAEEFYKLLPKILDSNFLPDEEFQKIKSVLKICAICCYKAQIAAETKNLQYINKENEIEDNDIVCRFCKMDKWVMKIDTTWKSFVEKTDGLLTLRDFPVYACPKCVYFFDTIFTIRNKLSYKFPQLTVRKKKPVESREKRKRQNETPKKKSATKSPPSSKKRKIFDNCFTYLQPLSTNSYHVDKELKADHTLYRKIAYVDLKDLQDSDINQTPKLRPIIKIKLKPSKKSDGKVQTYIKVSKSEEIPRKSSKHQHRRHSYIIDSKKENDSSSDKEQLNETPKSAIISNIVPKRRVSIFIEKISKEKNEEVEENVEQAQKDDDNNTEDNGKSNSLIEENKENVETDKNSEKSTSDKVVEGCEETQNLEVVNGNKTQEPPPENVAEEGKSKDSIENNNSNAERISRKTCSKSGSDSDSSVSDSSDAKEKNDSSVFDSDVLNGSERKKKKVTFSDEVY